MNRHEPMPTLPSGTADAVLDALPHPVIMVAADGRIANANLRRPILLRGLPAAAAPTSFARSGAVRQPLALSHRAGACPWCRRQRIQGRSRHPRNPGERLVDLHVAPLPERPDHVVVMLQERTIADKMDRQLTHRGAARSVIALAAMLAHEIKNPLSGIRGAAQLLEQSVGDDDRTLTQLICDETDRIVKLVDRMEVFTDERPVERAPVATFTPCSST